EATVKLGTREFCRLSYAFMLGIALAFACAYAVLNLWAPDVFAVIFGERWREAGAMAAVLAVPTMLSSLTSWPEPVFQLTGWQHWMLAIQLGFDALSISSVLVALRVSASPLTTVAVVAAVQCLYHLGYLAAVFHLASIRWKEYLNLLFAMAAMFIVMRCIGS